MGPSWEPLVVWFVFIVGTLNLALGFLMAVALTQPPPWNCWIPAWIGRLPRLAWRIPDWRRLPDWQKLLDSRKLPDWRKLLDWRTLLQLLQRSARRSRRCRRLPRPPLRPATGTCPPPPKPLGFKLEELPGRWLDLLGAEGVTPGSFLEAATHVIGLEVSQYREQLISAENRARGCLAAADADGLRQLCDDVQQFNQDWLVQQTQAGHVLKDRRGAHGDHERAAAELEQVLHDQTATIQECDVTLAALHGRTEIETGCKLVFEQMAHLLDQAHALATGSTTSWPPCCAPREGSTA